MKRTAFVSILLVAFVVAGWAADTEPVEYLLRYNPQQPLTINQMLSSKITKITMDKSPLGIEGTASGDLSYSHSAMDAEKPSFEMTLKLQNIEQRVMQQAFNVDETSETQLTVSPVGSLSVERADSETERSRQETMGIPMRLLSLMCHIIRFPEETLRCGDDWSVDEALQLSDGDPLNIAMNNTLVSVADDRYATIQSSVDTFIKYFETPNPMGYGGPMPVMDADLRIIDMQRVFDMHQSVVTEATGSLMFSADVDLGGQISHVTAEGTFEMKIRPDAEEEAVAQQATDDEGAADETGDAPDDDGDTATEPETEGEDTQQPEEGNGAEE